MSTHVLKTDPEVFQAVLDRRKSFEIRRNDRHFREGDLLHLRETKHSGQDMKDGSPLIYTGRAILASVSYVLHGPIYGLNENWCIMSINPMEAFRNDSLNAALNITEKAGVKIDALQTALRNLVDIVERVQASQSRFGYVNGRDSGELETKLDESKALLPEAKQNEI